MKKNTLYTCVVIFKGVRMSFNYNNMGGMMNGMSGMGMMGGMYGMNSSMNSSGNVWQYYTAKYGCEDCFSHEPNWFELHSKVHHTEHQKAKPNLWQRILSSLGC